MHIFFSGIGGAGIGPLALIARQAGYEVSGSDAQDSDYVGYLRGKGIDISVGQSHDHIAAAHAKRPIDWLVYSSALPKTDQNHPELAFCRENNIKATRRADLLNEILSQKKLKMLAVAGTHGKTTTTAMIIWLFKQLDRPISYSVGAKISFGEMGEYQSGSEYFVYEADEYDRNFLSFYPAIGTITGLDWDHPDTYPTREAYEEAFVEFLDQCEWAVIWHDDAEKLGIDKTDKYTIMDSQEPAINNSITLKGWVNRANAWQAVQVVKLVSGLDEARLVEIINQFPGLARRFEKIANNLYTDYAHTPPKIRGALQLAQEIAGDNVVVVYEGLHNTRQHFIKNELAGLFDGVKELYIVPSYMAREDRNLEILTPVNILDLLSISAKAKAHAAELNDDLKSAIGKHLTAGDLVLAFSAGGGGSLDEWLRRQFG
jgi:UDP-N-acetylmuramate--alanine ligase